MQNMKVEIVLVECIMCPVVDASTLQQDCGYVAPKVQKWVHIFVPSDKQIKHMGKICVSSAPSERYTIV